MATTISSRDAISPRCSAGDLFAQPDRIDVGGVEEIDPGVEREFEMRAGVFLVDVPALRADRPFGQVAAAVTHASEAEARNGDSGVAESLELHRLDLIE